MNPKLSRPAVFIAQGAIFAAFYVVITLLTAPISFREIQVRVSEAFTIMPCFFAGAVPGLTIGCFLANLLSGAVIWDVIFGTVATGIGAVGTWLLRKRSPWLLPLPPIISNTIIIPLVLRYGYGLDLPIPWMMLTVGIGEVISCGILGLLLRKAVMHILPKVIGSQQ